MQRTRVIGLGSEIHGDDGVGLEVARLVRRSPEAATLDVVESTVGGFALMELMAGWDVVLLVDAIRSPDLEPGTVVQLEPSRIEGASLRLLAPHEVDLATALALGRQMGHSMPGQVCIVGVQIADLRTFTEGLTPPVQAAVPRAVALVLELLGVAC